MRRSTSDGTTWSGRYAGFLLLFLIAVLALALASSCGNSGRREATRNLPSPALGLGPNWVSGQEPEIRVAVARGVREARLQALQAPVAIIGRGGQSLGCLQAGQEARLCAGAGLVLTGPAGLAADSGVELRAAGGGVGLDGHELAPRVTVLRDGAGDGVTVVARLRLEEYLAGVLAGEVPYTRWAPEALKAQAVASRSYALWQMKNRAGEAYDVECSEASQVFRPGVRGNPILNAAVNATRGQAVTCQGRLFPAYFHSTCGGSTSPAERVFPEQPPVATLRGTTCPFCRASPSFAWSFQIAKEDLRRKLAASPELAGAQWGAVQGLEFFGTCGGTGRAESVRVLFANGPAVLPANRFRLLAGSHDLKSVRIAGVTDLGTALELRGYGFGHGVGMCQYGSQGMALQGYSYEQILGFYYPGGELTCFYGNPQMAGR